MTYNKMTIDDIINWCQTNGKVEWLKATAAKTREYKVYPRVKVEGKTTVDKSQKPTIEIRPYSFIDIKLAFVNEFMPELAPKAKEKKLSMYERIKAL